MAASLCSCHSAKPWAFDIDGILRAIGPKTKVMFLCSPNNPTGNSLSGEQLLAILDAGHSHVVDQAYLECGTQSPLRRLCEHRNLVVTRTMSKGFGLAALRVGYGIADPWLVDVLHRMRIPFSLNLVGLGPVSPRSTILTTSPSRRASHQR